MQGVSGVLAFGGGAFPSSRAVRGGEKRSEGGRDIDWIARVLAWLEPYLAWGLRHLESGSPLGLLLAVVAGVALGLTPATYPMVPAVVGYVSGEEKLTRERAAVLSLAFVLGVSTVYAVLGIAFGMLGLALLTLLNRSIWLWYGLLAPVLWVMGLRALGLLRLGVPMLAVPDVERAKRGLLGAFLLGMPFGLAGCPTCALILPSVLTAVAASGSPAMGALVMFGLGIGQGAVLVAAGALGGGSLGSGWLYRYRAAVEKGLGVVLVLTAAYFTWRAMLWL
ncbi:cytochrome c biogenesis protein, transmembrane region [Rubrobacter xylanophilus DSM 9941]|uniref:Cytochrome c biogenesis protein, transmembrane region n=1 Tax=Rubrobacter xylanophilus (strain DSM 9941 / JCM 11954 / NBRC 16129 / PRD-1) TaxID=266117 RepID=Q1AUZ5_RUBXD|nr:cytochrome c biogenesis protein CcdA [Rubrobacter xylanophilus]ABG04783.1 cytochrome c biogenesis protein, transmembrane region [Rubrobacter xylanophilus DSM 9941]